MREGSSEVGAVCVCRLLLGRVDVLAPRAVHLDSCDLQVLADGDGQHVLLLAHHPWAVAESSSQVPLTHDGESLRRGDVSGVDEAVEFGGVLVHLQKPESSLPYLGSSTSSSAGGTVLSIILSASLHKKARTRTC